MKDVDQSIWDASLGIQSILSQGMGQTRHWFPADAPASRLAVVLVGMANTHGGTVLVGISPRSGQIQGISDPAEIMDRVFQAALMSDPPLVLPVPRLQTAGRAQVLSISVPAGLPNVYSLDGRYLGREGSQTNPLPARRLRQLLLERGVIQFESQVPPYATLDDLDDQKVAAYLQALNLPGNEPAEEILLRRGCLRPAGNTPTADSQGQFLRPTYAGLLLFGRQPQRWLPNATLLAARFSGASLADRFLKQDITGTLPDQIRLAEIFVRENLPSQVRLDGLVHTEKSEYPLEAIRELLVNAVAHRDYNLQGDNIHLNIFVNRLEIHSPGGLPGPVNLQNLLEARFSRNAVIVQVLSDMGFVERLGYGLNRVVEILRQESLRPPQFEDADGTFRVTLFAPAADRPQLPELQCLKDVGDLNPRQMSALNFLASRKRITSRDYQELCPDVHAETLRRDLVDLVERNLLIKIGDKRATYYVLKR